jgi:hypothetical protein
MRIAMRRNLVTAALLIPLLLTTASACASGWELWPSDSCTPAITRKACAGKQPHAAIAQGRSHRAVLRPAPSRCSFRSFFQFQFPAFQKFEICAPLSCAKSISVPRNTSILFSSVGSPKTDRGPPHS